MSVQVIVSITKGKNMQCIWKEGKEEGEWNTERKLKCRCTYGMLKEFNELQQEYKRVVGH